MRGSSLDDNLDDNRADQPRHLAITGHGIGASNTRI